MTRLIQLIFLSLILSGFTTTVTGGKDSEYELWLENCTKNEEMPYFNETVNEYECYPILEQGPCEPNYWFVLDQHKTSSAKCAKKLIHDKKNCPPNQEILPNPFGIGI